MPAVRATFDCREPETHLVRVTMRFPPTEEAARTFRMAAWVPGSYKIRDFGRHVQDVVAMVGGRPAAVVQPTKDAWIVDGTAGKAVELQYRVYCRELTVDTSHVTAQHAHLLPVTLVMYDGASRGLPHEVEVVAPPGWRAWSGLETPALDGTLAPAADYDHLIDCPIEVAPPELVHEERFEARGHPHRLVFWMPPAGVDWPRIARDVKAIVQEAAKVFGGLPYEHYTFLGHVAVDHGGGLEHRNSTVLGVDPNHLLSDEKRQQRFYPLVAHEFFHTWNVKRILPAAFQPYQLQQESYTGLLWLFEGFTSYYELPLLWRAKVCDHDNWAKMVAEDLEWYEKAVGRRRLPVAQASRLTWTLLYQPHEHNINRNVSYYTKGMWVGLCLDAELRRRGVPDGLDAVMRHLWRKHGQTGVGLTEDAFPDVVEQAVELALSGRGRGASPAAARKAKAAARGLRRLILSWTEGTQELPVEQAFRSLGFDLKREWKDPKRRLGLNVMFKPGGTTIERIPEDAPAWKVLQPDDEVVAADGYRFRPDRFAEQVAGKKAGEPVAVTVFREGRLLTVPVPLAELPKDKVTVTMRKKDRIAERSRMAWLGAGLPPPKQAKEGAGARKPASRGRGPPPADRAQARKLKPRTQPLR
ncbi:MAG TPA: PDZ domain-containing protein [Candidatus Thermoplasmatota archaeon]|nr:PDZ domain-containing protein [Candidatus Thermoplasmatota archaeon]